jgi:glucan phosphoethanolaminetransferase (alkaline phosphatase superfamily)
MDQSQMVSSLAHGDPYKDIVNIIILHLFGSHTAIYLEKFIPIQY